MKKLLALLLCIAMLVPMAAMAEGDGRTHITYSFWGNQTEAESVQKALDEFNAMQDKIFVEPMQIPNEEYTQTLVNYAIAGQLPDCGMVNENSVLYFARNGVMADVSKMYEGEALQPMECITFKDGETPVGYSSSNEILVLYYNKAMFDAANEPYPSADKPYTWEEFVEVAKRLTLDKNGKHPGEEGFDKDNIVQYGCVVDNWTWQLEVWALSNGGRWFSEDGKECTINDPAVIESIQKVADLTLVEHVMPYNAGLEDNGIQRSIATGNVAMATGGAWNVGTCLNTAREDIGLNYGVARLPKMIEEVTICTGGPQVVFSQTKHPAEAMEFIKWYTKEENSWDSLIATGIWMPILEKYYTDPELTAKWIENPNFPDAEEYKAAVVDYAMECAQSTCWYYVPHTNDFINLLRSVLGPVWTGEQTAEQAITENFDALNDIFLGF